MVLKNGSKQKNISLKDYIEYYKQYKYWLTVYRYQRDIYKTHSKHWQVDLANRAVKYGEECIQEIKNIEKHYSTLMSKECLDMQYIQNLLLKTFMKKANFKTLAS